MTEFLSSGEDSHQRVTDLCAQGEYDAALVLATTAVATYEAKAEVGVSSDPHLFASSLQSLAMVHECLSHYAEAAECADRAVEIWQGAGRDQEPQLAMALHTRAMSHLASEEVEPALPLLERAAEILEAAGESYLQDFTSILLTMAGVSNHHGDFEHGRSLYARVLETMADTKPLSDDHAAWLNGMSARALFGLGSSYAQGGQGDEAVDYLSRSIELFEVGYGLDHPEVVSAKQAIASIYRVIGRGDAAAAIENEIEAVERHDETGTGEIDLVVNFGDEDS